MIGLLITGARPAGDKAASNKQTSPNEFRFPIKSDITARWADEWAKADEDVYLTIERLLEFGATTANRAERRSLARKMTRRADSRQKQ